MQVSAAIMAFMHRTLKIELSSAVVIAGGAAGVSAAFNTPLAGVAFAIEELASFLPTASCAAGYGCGYDFWSGKHGPCWRLCLFRRGPSDDGVRPFVGHLVVGRCPRWRLWRSFFLARYSLRTFRKWGPALSARRYPVWFAAGCGLVIAMLGIGTNGATWGAGYDSAKMLVESQAQPLWFGPAKFFSTLVTMVSGTPGGIFAPSLATGAGVGNLLAVLFPKQPLGAVVILE